MSLVICWCLVCLLVFCSLLVVILMLKYVVGCLLENVDMRSGRMVSC